MLVLRRVDMGTVLESRRDQITSPLQGRLRWPTARALWGLRGRYRWICSGTWFVLRRFLSCSYKCYFLLRVPFMCLFPVGLDDRFCISISESCSLLGAGTPGPKLSDRPHPTCLSGGSKFVRTREFWAKVRSDSQSDLSPIFSGPGVGYRPRDSRVSLGALPCTPPGFRSRLVSQPIDWCHAPTLKLLNVYSWRCSFYNFPPLRTDSLYSFVLALRDQE